MPNTYPKFVWPFASGPTGTIPFRVSGVDYLATIAAPASVYALLALDAADPQVGVDLIRAIETAINAASGAGIQLVTINHTPSAAEYGRIRATDSVGTFEWRWTQAHTFDETLLGFTAGADVASGGAGQYAYAQAQHTRGWYPRDVFAEDRLSRPAAEVATHRATSGVRRTYRFATKISRDVRFDFLSRTDILTAAATGADLNRDFEQLWDHLSQGGRVYYFPNMSYVGMYLSAAAFLATLRDQADMESFSAVADFMFPTVEFWRVALRLEGYVVP